MSFTAANAVTAANASIDDICKIIAGAAAAGSFSVIVQCPTAVATALGTLGYSVQPATYPQLPGQWRVLWI